MLDGAKHTGLVKDRLEGKAETCLPERRFGPWSGDLRKRITSADIVQFDTWFDAVIDAPDLTAFLESSPIIEPNCHGRCG